MILNHALLFIFWGIYFFLHSFLLDSRVKDKIVERLGKSGTFYRIIYNFISTVGIVLIFLYTYSIQSPTLVESTIFLFVVGLILISGGFLLGWIAFRNYDTAVFLGLKNPDSRGVADKLQVTGLQSRVRHPLYTATIGIFTGYFCMFPNWASLITLGAVCLYLTIGIQLEEKKLIQTFGQQYRNYKKTTPALIPKIFK